MILKNILGNFQYHFFQKKNNFHSIPVLKKKERKISSKTNRLNYDYSQPEVYEICVVEVESVVDFDGISFLDVIPKV